MLDTFSEYVYAGLLGKVIGVYMGRPFEGWSHDRILQQLGEIDHYVAAELNVPLVVSDDDISGTLTFIRALEDSPLHAETPDSFYGQTWLNYLLENDTILWWGGMGMSTEHTAYLRLKQGIPSPQSGSIALNGPKVAEQIGAQIFIDAYGLVCGGNPDLAAKLARRAAAVSHDGEALNAAVVVAVMLAAALREKDLEHLLDLAVSYIPADSLIARLHRDVRAWSRQYPDWKDTFARIRETYGYDRYGGNCHVVPNHAVMVMAWSYAQNDFRRAQTIVNTAGWDTDCNAANVGSVMGAVLGLDAICASYDFRAPIADRIILPTADGTQAATDCWLEAQRLIRLAAILRGETPPAAPAHWLDFAAPGAVHGFLPDTPNLTADNPDGAGLRLHVSNADNAPATAATPVLPLPVKGGYTIVGTPKLYPGMTVSADVEATADTTLTLFATTANATFRGTPLAGHGTAILTIPDTDGLPVLSLGLEIHTTSPDTRELTIRHIDAGGPFRCHWNLLPRNGSAIPGWLTKHDGLRGTFSDDPEPLDRFLSNGERRFAITGNRWWQDVTVEARVNPHIADIAGIIASYQGTERYLSLSRRGDLLVLALRHYGETILAQIPCDWPLDQSRTLRLELRGNAATAFLDGQPVLSATNLPFANGAAGCLFAAGNVGYSQFTVTGTAIPCY